MMLKGPIFFTVSWKKKKKKEEKKKKKVLVFHVAKPKVLFILY